MGEQDTAGTLFQRGPPREGRASLCSCCLLGMRRDRGNLLLSCVLVFRVAGPGADGPPADSRGPQTGPRTSAFRPPAPPLPQASGRATFLSIRPPPPATAGHDHEGFVVPPPPHQKVFTTPQPYDHGPIRLRGLAHQAPCASPSPPAALPESGGSAGATKDELVMRSAPADWPLWRPDAVRVWRRRLFLRPLAGMTERTGALTTSRAIVAYPAIGTQ